jgi:YHS domain-containing protein
MKLDGSQFLQSACGGLLKDISRYPDAMYRGEKVYFCNSACLRTFLEFPDSFMAGEIEHPKPEEFRSNIQ